MLDYFKAIWNLFRHFGDLWPYGKILAIWFIFPCFGILYQEKSGNPDLETFGIILFAQLRNSFQSGHPVGKSPSKSISSRSHHLKMSDKR
jgi:hypothetical protein